MRTFGRAGRWGKPDAEINWCEEDYMLSEWIAEPVNTVTNAVFIVLPVVFLASHTTSTEVRFQAVIIVVIGLGSVLYHATLRYNMMLADELPILWYGMLVSSTSWRRLTGRDFCGLSFAHAALITITILLTDQHSQLHQATR
eukprot:3988358-Amphidinium_carterae.1